MLKIKSRCKKVKAAAKFYAGALNIDNVKITIGTIKDDGLITAFVIQPNDDEFELGLCVETLTNAVDLFEALAHEMVHIRQYNHGDLEDMGANKVRWKSRIYNDAQPHEKGYRKLPWEKEAYKKQEGLAKALFADKKFLKSLIGD